MLPLGNAEWMICRNSSYCFVTLNCMPYFKILFLVGKNSYCLRKFRTYKQKEDNALSTLLYICNLLAVGRSESLKKNNDQIVYIVMY